MTIINVAASKVYDVIIKNGILDDLGERITGLFGRCTAVIISDDNVFPLYGERVRKALKKWDLKVLELVLPNGEKSKSIATYAEVMKFLAENKVSRSDVIVALGGGVIGDLAGFAAATYLRGIKYVQVPTTLLAAVDSSVGGKTAVDLDIGKNLVGSFYQPSLVACDPETLTTLSSEVYRAGCAEIIKYGLLGNAEFFSELAKVPVKEQYEKVIATCVSMKRDIVKRDEFDTGKRQLLNLGHTFGHAIEAKSDFSLSHGFCVAIGMAIISKAAVRKGICDKSVSEAVVSILKKYSLPTVSPYTAEIICEAVGSDKKIFSSKLNLVVPEAVGKCRIISTPLFEIPGWLEGMEVSAK